MGDCYIYYRVAAEREQAARRALFAMLSELQASTGIIGHVHCKAMEPLLWMEVYPAVADPDALVEVLARMAERHGLIACLADSQRRHVEHFLPLTPQ